MSWTSAWLVKEVIGQTNQNFAGMPIHYRLTYTNTGSTPISILLSDQIPSSLLYNPLLTTSRCPGNSNSNFSVAYNPLLATVSTNTCSLAVWSSAVVDFNALIVAPSFTSIINTASVNVYDSGNNFIRTESNSITLLPYANLRVEKMFTWSLPQKFGDLVTFQIKVYNFWSTDATNIILQDIIPNGFVLQSSTLPGTPTYSSLTNTYTWILPSLSAQSTGLYTIVARLNTTIPGAWLSVWSKVTNTVVISTWSNSSPSYIVFNDNPSLSSSTGTSIFAIAGVPEVTLTKTLITPNTSGHLYQSGDQVGYRITLYNSGNATASGLLTDYFPSQLTPLSASIAPTSTAGSVWSRNNISIAPSQTLTVFLTGILNNNYSSNTTYTNNADFVLTNLSGSIVDNGTAVWTILGRPDLVVTKTLLSSMPQISWDTVVYRLTLANSGTTTFTGTRCLSDVWPSQLTFVNSSVAVWWCNGIYSWSGDANNLPFSIILTGILNPTASAGMTIVNTWSVFTTTAQLSTANDASSAAIVVGGVGILNMSKTSASSINWISGTIIRYTLNYSNSGTQTISGLVLSDVLPVWLSYVSGTLSPTSNGATLTWPTINLLPGSGWSIVMDTRLNTSFLSGSLTNCISATATSRYLSWVLSDRCSTISFVSVPDLSIKKTILSGVQWLSGSTVVFKLDIANNGSTGVNNVNLIDTISTGIILLPWVSSSFGSSSNLVQTAPGQYSLTIGSLSPGMSGTLIYTGVLNFQPTSTYNYTNTANLTGSFIDANINDNTSTVSSSAAVAVWCVLTKAGQWVWSTSQWWVDLSGQIVSYTINLTNNGTIPLTNISLSDTRPSWLTRPTNLDTNNIFAAGVSLNPGQTTGFVLTGKLLTRASVSLLNSVTANYTINGVPFSCWWSGDVVKKAPSCNNWYLEEGEQCDVYVNNGITSVITLSGSLFNTNSFSFDGGATTQTCDACKLKATAAKNCVTMTVPWLSPKVSCADLQIPTDTVKLTLKKYVDGNDAQDSASAVTKQAGNEAEYKILITNTSSTNATDVILSDTLPAGVEYIPGTLSPTTVTYTNGTINGNLGTLAWWQSVTVTLRVRVTSNNSSITNIATVNYKDSGGVPQSPVSDPAVIKWWNNLCQNNTLDAGEQCDLGLGGTIGDYLDGNRTTRSTSSQRWAICTSSCIIDTSLNRCGDGRLGRLEQCDLGVNGGTIGTHLDTLATVMASSQYQGKKCDIGCNIVGNPTIPACWYTDTVISVMKDEVLPIAWDVEISSGVVETSSQCNASNNGMIVKDSLECTFRIYNKNEESDTRDWWASSFDRTLPCNTQQWKNSNGELYKAFQNDPLFVERPYGSFLVGVDVDVNGNKLDLKNWYGEYKVSLDKVSYSYCDGNGKSTKSPNVYARVCQINIAVTRPYLMQKSNTIYKSNDTLKDFFVLGYPDKTIISATQFDSLSERTQLSSLEYKWSIKTLTENLVKKYESIAVKVDTGKLWSLANAKKVPGKAIYIVEWDSTFEPGYGPTTPTTLIVKNGDLVIKGNVSSNTLILVPNGSVRFDLLNDTEDENIQYSSEDHRCGPQVIRGIVVAKEFVASDEDLWNTRANINDHSRCRKGNLQVYGALYGNNLEDLVQSRRSHLEHWFTYRTNFGISTAPTQTPKNAERRDEIYKGASVYIEQNPDLWRSMPPGAEDFLKTLNVSRN
jgi:uncharacterized repeat protein (TIGR01451 family)